MSLGATLAELSKIEEDHKEKKAAFDYFENSLKKNELPIENIEKNDDWNNFKDDIDFIELLNRYRNEE